MSSEVGLAKEQEALTPAIMENVLVGGDLSKLTPTQRTSYYKATCESLGLNPLTKPFDYIVLNGRMQLYARKDCTEQLRNNKSISLKIVSRESVNDVYIVTAQATTPNGRTDESIGAVSIGGSKGNDLANAIMKAETKAKRRVTLSICGLGMLDETELETIKDVGKPEVAMPKAVEAHKPEEKQKEAPKAQEAVIVQPDASKPQQSESIEEIGEDFKPLDTPVLSNSALEQFEKARLSLGDEEFYKILGGEGYENPNQIENERRAEWVMALLKVAKKKDKK